MVLVDLTRISGAWKVYRIKQGFRVSNLGRVHPDFVVKIWQLFVSSVVKVVAKYNSSDDPCGVFGIVIIVSVDLACFKRLYQLLFRIKSSKL